MDIGQKLKQARAAAGLTQEQAAGALGVSRQTVSNWENCRSYPDVAMVLAMSELYRVSLDELLKGDRKMIDHLEQSTDTVASRNRLARRITVLAYLVVWALVILTFWLGGRQDAMGYALVNLYLAAVFRRPVHAGALRHFLAGQHGQFWAAAPARSRHHAARHPVCGGGHGHRLPGAAAEAAPQAERPAVIRTCKAGPGRRECPRRRGRFLLPQKRRHCPPKQNTSGTLPAPKVRQAMRHMALAWMRSCQTKRRQTFFSDHCSP